MNPYIEAAIITGVFVLLGALVTGLFALRSQRRAWRVSNGTTPGQMLEFLYEIHVEPGRHPIVWDRAAADRPERRAKSRRAR